MEQQEDRAVNFPKFIDYIQHNFKTNLTENDYELLRIIAKDYSSKQIYNAIQFCLKKNVKTIRYLLSLLRNNTKKSDYRTISKSNITPKWFDEDLKIEPLDEEDIKWLEDFHRRYATDESLMRKTK